MTAFTALLRKESRQQGSLALAMVFLCFVVQLGAHLLAFFPAFAASHPISYFGYFGIAVLVTALFTGAATAISFAGEHEEGTFGFLRNLPVTPRMIFWGKSAWLLLGTVAVLMGTSFLAGIYMIFDRRPAALDGGEVFGVFGVGILEAFAWGLFWSPRCRSQINALLATYFCSSLFGYLAASISSGYSFVEIYCNAVPLRLGIVLCVGLYGAFGATRWYERWIQRQGTGSISAGIENVGNVFLGRWFYPKTIQYPFIALLLQSVRQSRTLLLMGMVLLLLEYGYVALYQIFPGACTKFHQSLLGNLMLFAATFFVLIFCGSIFAQDQKNESYRFLARCGVSAKAIWWSRVLPFLCIYLPAAIGIAMIVVENADPELNHYVRYVHGESFASALFWYVFMIVLPLSLIPFSVGAFLSVSLRRPIVAISLIVPGSALVFLWTYLAFLLFLYLPIWTTLPLCLALLAASRLRVADWLRERKTWGTRFRPLIPLAATILLLLAVVPPLRVYSIPLISLDEIEEQFRQFDLYVEKMSLEQRAARFAELRAIPWNPSQQRSNDPSVDWAYLSSIRRYIYNENVFDMMMLSTRAEIHQQIQELEGLTPEERKTKTYKKMEELVDAIPTYDAMLLGLYEHRRRNIYETMHSSMSYKLWLPWEYHRALRVLNAHLYTSIYFCNFLDMPKDHPLYQFRENEYNNTVGLMDMKDFFWWHRADDRSFMFYACCMRLELVRAALAGWYEEHDQTLPDSLDQLVGTYLTKLPTDPKTGESIEYHKEVDEDIVKLFRDKPFPSYMSVKPGWACLTLGKVTRDLSFLPGYAEYGKENSQAFAP